jgi:hypothetical protein
LEGHRLGENKAAREELLHTFQEPEKEAGQPRPHGASGEAPGELVPQGGECECSPEVGCGVCSRGQCQADLLWVADAAVSNKRRLPSGSEQATQVKRMPAKCPSCEASTCDFLPAGSGQQGCPRGRRSGFQDDATPTATEKAEKGAI